MDLINLRTSKYGEAFKKAGKNSKEIRRLLGLIDEDIGLSIGAKGVADKYGDLKSQ